MPGKERTWRGFHDHSGFAELALITGQGKRPPDPGPETKELQAILIVQPPVGPTPDRRQAELDMGTDLGFLELVSSLTGAARKKSRVAGLKRTYASSSGQNCSRVSWAHPRCDSTITNNPTRTTLPSALIVPALPMILTGLP